jgi:hypothetical protein
VIRFTGVVNYLPNTCQRYRASTKLRQQMLVDKCNTNMRGLSAGRYLHIIQVMGWSPLRAFRWLFAPMEAESRRIIARWLFLRALGAIYFSAFFSLVFQIRGLIGPQGILPAGPYLRAVAQSLGSWQRFWYAPTLLWFSSGSGILNALC